jgi:hypothetical protein
MATREERLAEAARQYEQAAEHLRLAAAHLDRSGEHYRAGDVPRGGVHAWSARGAILEAEELLDRLARIQTERSQV